MSFRWLIATLLATALGVTMQVNSVHAQSSFVETEAPFENGANAVAVADVDGDGDLDSWFGYDSGSRIYLNANGVWTDSGQFLGQSDFIRDVAFGDFDADGDADAVTLDADNIALWINQGGIQAGVAGTYLAGSTFPTDLATRLAVGDLNNDNDVDFIVARGGNRPDLVWITNGNISFLESNAFSTDVALGDIDGDDDLDAIITTIDTSTDNPIPLNEIWLNTTTHVTQSATLFVDSGLRLGTGDGATIDLGDVDNDGDLDVWIGGLTGVDTLWINQGGLQAGTEGTFVQSVQQLGSFTKDVVLSDVDGDGDLDAVVARSNTGVWLNQGGLQKGTIGTFFFRGQNIAGTVQRIALGKFKFAPNSAVYPDLLVAPDANTSPTRYWRNGNPAAVQIYRDMREGVMRNSPTGSHYIQVYEDHTSEIVGLMLTDPEINANMLVGIEAWTPAVDALADGNGDEVLVTTEMVGVLDTVLQNLEETGSKPLQEAIADERDAIGKPLTDFVGMTVDQASTDLLGDRIFQLFIPNLAQNEEDGAIAWSLRPSQTENECAVQCALVDCTNLQPPPSTEAMTGVSWARLRTNTN